MGYFDPNIDKASQELVTVAAALRQVYGPSHPGETGSERVGNDPFGEHLNRIDWNEKIVGETVLHVDNVVTTAAGAGAVANTDKAITELERAISAAESGWTGAAAAQFLAFTAAVKNNLENVKDELEKWAKEVAGDAMENPLSATEEMNDITRSVFREAARIADAYDAPARTVLAGWETGRADPDIVAAGQKVQEAATEFDTFVATKFGQIADKVYAPVNTHAGAVVVISDPHNAQPALIEAGFGVSVPALIAARNHAEVSLAMLRDAHRNLGFAREGSMPFGWNDPARKTAKAWQVAATYRIEDVERLITHVSEVIEGLESMQLIYMDNEKRLNDDLKNVINADNMRKLLSDSRSDQLTVELKYIPSDANLPRTEIHDILDSDWEGVGKLPEVPVRGPGDIGEVPPVGVPEEE